MRMASDLDQQGRCSSLHVRLQAHSPSFHDASNPCTQFAQYGNPEEKSYLGANGRSKRGDRVGDGKDHLDKWFEVFQLRL